MSDPHFVSFLRESTKYRPSKKEAVAKRVRETKSYLYGFKVLGERNRKRAQAKKACQGVAK